MLGTSDGGDVIWLSDGPFGRSCTQVGVALKLKIRVMCNHIT